MHRVETGTELPTGRPRSWWLDTIASDQELARDYVKSHGRTAKDVMTREVISVTETTDLAEVALLLETNGMERVPVLRDGKLVGLVSRANLVRALAVTNSDPPVDAATDDRAIRARLLAELIGHGWAGVARRRREYRRRAARRRAHHPVALGPAPSAEAGWLKGSPDKR